MAKERNDLSGEAVKINGTYIEDIVTGYETVKSAGRELIGRDLETTDTKNDGAILRNVKYSPREIEVDFFVLRNSMPNMRTAMDAVKAALDVKEAEFIFNEDPDYFFIGTPVMNEGYTELRNGYYGSFTIHCNDPFKYSVLEKTATSSAGEFNITYNGTYKSYPTFVAEFANSENADGDSTELSECGFVGFANQREKILQFGDPEETDWADVNYPATVPVNKEFKSTSGWTLNNSSVITGTQTGSMAIGSDQTHWTYPSGYGSGSNYHGPSLSKIITGETEPIGKNFNFTWSMLFGGVETQVVTQFGGFECLLWNYDSGTRQLVCGVRVLKTARNANCTVYLYIGSTSRALYHYTVNCSKLGNNSIKKMGDTITFNVGQVQRTYNGTLINNILSTVVANEITFHFMKKGSNNALSPFRLYRCKLQRLPFDQYEDIANVFSPGDVLTVETKNAGVYLDDGSATIPAAYVGALGNDWEDFYLTPGPNIIGVDYSDFTTDPPTFTIKYRERFI